MKNKLIISAIFILPVLVYAIISFSAGAKTEAFDNTKPSVIKFSSKLCMDCKKLEKVVQEVVPSYKNDINYQEIKVDENSKYVDGKIKEYDVVLVPTLVYIDKQGSVVKKTEGFVEKSVFESNIKGLINGTLR